MDILVHLDYEMINLID